MNQFEPSAPSNTTPMLSGKLYLDEPTNKTVPRSIEVVAPYKITGAEYARFKDWFQATFRVEEQDDAS